MSQILHIDASPRGVGEASAKHSRSISRTLAQEFIAGWQAAHPTDTTTYRDLGHNPLPYVDESWIAAAFSSPADHCPELKAAISLSDNLQQLESGLLQPPTLKPNIDRTFHVCGVSYLNAKCCSRRISSSRSLSVCRPHV